MSQIAMLHYAGPPGVGGVESTIAYHARGLTDLGYSVRVISGSGEMFDPRIETIVDPRFGSVTEDVLHVKAELDAGQVGQAFEAATDQIARSLAKSLQGCSICIAHNIPTFNKNLPLTAALEKLHREGRFRLIAWCHDLAWTNPHYTAELHDGYPWNLLRTAWPGATYVTVSESRGIELSLLLGIPRQDVYVVVPGVDPARFFRWTPQTEKIEAAFQLMDSDGILLLPARITRRKNIELGIRILCGMREQSGHDWRLIVTGPPGPHNPKNPGYLDELLQLRHRLGLEQSVHFVYELGDQDKPFVPDDDTMSDLFMLADGLLFPSTQEGFGIPVLEAGLAGIPAFCADIPPLRQTGQKDVLYFDPASSDPGHIAHQILIIMGGYAPYRLRLRVRKQYRWNAIIREQIVPLLNG